MNLWVIQGTFYKPGGEWDVVGEGHSLGELVPWGVLVSHEYPSQVQCLNSHTHD